MKPIMSLMMNSGHVTAPGPRRPEAVSSSRRLAVARDRTAQSLDLLLGGLELARQSVRLGGQSVECLPTRRVLHRRGEVDEVALADLELPLRSGVVDAQVDRKSVV